MYGAELRQKAWKRCGEGCHVVGEPIETEHFSAAIRISYLDFVSDRKAGWLPITRPLKKRREFILDSYRSHMLKDRLS